MKIETKYEIGQEVWVMKDDRPQKFIVNGLNVKCSSGMYKGTFHIVDSPIVTYDLGSRMSPLVYNDIYLFPTKEELLKSL